MLWYKIVFNKNLNSSGIMVFEALCPQYDFSDETIQRIVGIFETNAIEIRMAATSDVMALFETACLLEHSCIPNLHITFDKKFNVSQFRKIHIIYIIIIVETIIYRHYKT